MKRRATPAPIVLGLALALACAGCASGTSAFAGPPVQHATHVVYLDIEDAETLQGPNGAGIATALRYLAMPRLATFYEASVFGPYCAGAFAGCGNGIGASAGALERAVRRLSPTVVTIEAGVTPIGNGTGPATFAAALGELLGGLRSGGVSTVLVANIAPWNLAPSASSFLASPLAFGREIDAYNRAIAAVAGRYGALLVDVHSVVAEAVASGGAASVFVAPSGSSAAPFALSPYTWHLVERAFLADLAHRRLGGEARAG